MKGCMQRLSMVLLVTSLVGCTGAAPDHHALPVSLDGIWIVNSAVTASLCYGLRIQGDAQPRSDAMFYWTPARSGCVRRSSGIAEVPADRRISAEDMAFTAEIGLIAGGSSHVQIRIDAWQGDTRRGLLTVDGASSSAQLVRVDRLGIPFGPPPLATG